jgi:hypothetical protein
VSFAVPPDLPVVALLDKPSATQLRVLEFIADTFMKNELRWPVFDYVEACLDDQGIDAWTELQALPREPNYSSIAWAPTQKPPREYRVVLTMLGIYHVEAVGPLRTGLAPLFLAVLDILAEKRRNCPRSPDKPRELSISSDELLQELAGRGIGDTRVTADLLVTIIDPEPPTGWGVGGQRGADGWTREISDQVRHFESVVDIRDYLDRVAAILTRPAPEASPAAPSPLGLVAAIDYLDTVWRSVPQHPDHLFTVHSAQRTAQLAFPANTAAEFDSRLSGLGELLRSVSLPPTAPATGKRRRDAPLAPLTSYLTSLLPDSQGRIERAAETLSSVLDVRDAGQHTAAGRKGAAALAKLGVGYPPPSWPDAWSTIMARTIGALDALREELATLSA